jgi:colicin import membrane protein
MGALTMNDINYSAVAAAAESLEKQGLEPSVRTVREKLGGGSNTTLTPMLRQWKEARTARLSSTVQLNPAISDLILAQMAEVASQAANDANIRAKDAADAFDELSAELKTLRLRLAEKEAELQTTREQVLQQQGQLNERAREMEEIRAQSVNAIHEADLRAADERSQAEALRQELVRTSIALESVPDLKAALEQAQNRIQVCANEVAQARQSAAVANEHAKAQAELASQAAMREAKLESHLNRLVEQHERALASERLLQQEILLLSKANAVLDARCKSQESELQKLRNAADGISRDHNGELDHPEDLI